MSHDCQENADHDVVYDVCPHSATGAHIQGMEAYKAMHVYIIIRGAPGSYESMDTHSDSWR